jgi:chorismate synthase
MGNGLSWTTAGESHGLGLVGVLEGMPAGLQLDLARVDAELARRQGGAGRSARQQLECDRAELIAGTRGGLTLGSPLALRIANRDASIESLPVPQNPRPGHADLAGCQKLGTPDPRAVLERASARETAMRVALGALARQLLEHFEIELHAHVIELGGVAAREDAYERAGARRDALRARSQLACIDEQAEARMLERIASAQEERDTLGGVFELRVRGLPPGLGDYANPAQRLSARLGAAFFSIPAIKSVEFGLGREAARVPGSQAHDAIEVAPEMGKYGVYRRATNRAGGLEGGMTTGEELVVRVAMKPIPTLRRGLPSVEFASKRSVSATYQRSDVTAVPAASVVGEAVAALVLASALREKLGGDTLEQMRAAMAHWSAQLRAL